MRTARGPGFGRHQIVGVAAVGVRDVDPGYRGVEGDMIVLGEGVGGCEEEDGGSLKEEAHWRHLAGFWDRGAGPGLVRGEGWSSGRLKRTIA